MLTPKTPKQVGSAIKQMINCGRYNYHCYIRYFSV